MEFQTECLNYLSSVISEKISTGWDGMGWVPLSQVKVIKLEFLLKCDSSVFFFFNCLSRSDMTGVTLLLDCGGWFGLVTSRSATQKEHLKVLAA